MAGTRQSGRPAEGLGPEAVEEAGSARAAAERWREADGATRQAPRAAPAADRWGTEAGVTHASLFPPEPARPSRLRLALAGTAALAILAMGGGILAILFSPGGLPRAGESASTEVASIAVEDIPLIPGVTTDLPEAEPTVGDQAEPTVGDPAEPATVDPAEPTAGDPAGSAAASAAAEPVPAASGAAAPRTAASETAPTDGRVRMVMPPTGAAAAAAAPSASAARAAPIDETVTGTAAPAPGAAPAPAGEARWIERWQGEETDLAGVAAGQADLAEEMREMETTAGGATPSPAAAPAAPETAAATAAEPEAPSAAGAPVEPPAAETETETAAVPPAGEGQPGRAVSAVNLRASGQSGSEVLGTVSAGTELRVLSCDYWCEVVTADGRRGFVYRDFVSTAQ